MPTPVGLGELDCGVLTSSKDGSKKNYENAMCERKLPYICKKSNSTKPTGERENERKEEGRKQRTQSLPQTGGVNETTRYVAQPSS